MIKESIFCDVCGAERGTVNHWFIIVDTEAAGISFYGHKLAFAVAPWGYGELKDFTGAKHVCGQACAHKLLNEFFERRAA